MNAKVKQPKEPVKACRRCGGTGRYVVGPIMNTEFGPRGRDLGPCYRCYGNGIDPRWSTWARKVGVLPPVEIPKPQAA